MIYFLGVFLGKQTRNKFQVYVFFGEARDLVKMQADGKGFITNGSLIYIFGSIIFSPIGIYLISGKTTTHTTRLVYNSICF